MEQASFTYDRELEVNGGPNTDRTLAPVRPDAGSGRTGRWLQGPISSFDQGDCVWRDRMLSGQVAGH